MKPETVIVFLVFPLLVGVLAGCGDEKPEPGKAAEQVEADKPVEEPQPRPKVYPKPPAGAILIDAPATLDKQGATYFLTKDVAADGTAFTVLEDNITLDLGGRTVVYNAKPAETPVHAVVTKKGKHGRRLGSGIYGIAVRNGVIIQGKGASKSSAALKLGGQFCVNYDIHHLEVYVHGVECVGISAEINDSKVHHNYVESHATTTRIDGRGCNAMGLRATLGGLDVYENVIARGHRGITVGGLATYKGTYLDKLGGHRPSKVHHNLIQHKRLEQGNKAPYGIAIFYARLVEVHNNQIVSDNGRGIILDGGARAGATENVIRDNLIDVQYSSTVTKGAYVENRVYGIRDRYSSGRNKIIGNRIFVTNGVKGYIAGIYVGSDKKDPRMDGIEITGNTIRVHGGTKAWLGPGATGIVLDWVDHIKVERNFITSDACPVIIRHAEEGVTIDANVFYQAPGRGKWTAAVTNENKLPFTGANQEGTTETGWIPPRVPRGLTVTKHLDAYVLRWNADRSASLRGYIVYRDGQQLPISPRGGGFYVDLGLRPGRHAVYAVSAVDIGGGETRRSRKVSTRDAQLGWDYGENQ